MFFKYFFIINNFFIIKKKIVDNKKTFKKHFLKNIEKSLKKNFLPLPGLEPGTFQVKVNPFTNYATRDLTEIE